MKGFSLSTAAELAICAIRDTNKFLTDQAPWHMKEELPKKECVRATLEAVYVAAHFLSPFIPNTALHIFCKLGTNPKPIWKLSEGFDNLVPGTTVDVGEILFEKVETEADAGAGGKAAGGKGGGGKGGGGKAAAGDKGAKKAPAPKKAVPEGPPDVSRLDLRVGVITHVEKHPDADALYVEKIDCGEPEPRTVVSGLVKYVPIEKMQGARVVIVANLKPSAMRGIKSFAMVLAASTADGATKELVTPPEGAAPGDRVTCAGFDGEPDEQLNPKKKVWEQVQPDLATSSECVVTYKGSPLTTDKGSCTVPTVAGGSVA